MSMTDDRALAALVALAHGTRLGVLRLLLRQGPNGLPAGEIARETSVPPSTLSSHLAQLEGAGLLRSCRLGQRIIYTAVTLCFVIRREIGLRDAGLYLLAQVAGAICGAMLAHGMFEEPIVAASTNARTGFSQWLGEFTATFGLVATILGCLRFRPELVPYGVGLFITAGYWFTSSTSFTNPAVTIARSLTDTFSGIMPVHMPAFIIAHLIGAVVATLLFGWLCTHPTKSPERDPK